MTHRRTPGMTISRGFTVVELLVVALMALALVSVGWPHWWEAPQQARMRETAWGLRQVQVALERYAADHGGRYPDFLYGGDFADDFTTSSSTRQSPWPGDLDALLEGGYLASYPRNPFVSASRKAQQFDARDWQLVRDPGRVGWYADGGDRALVLASRKVGGLKGQAMVDLTEGQRHAPPLWSLEIRKPDHRWLRIATPWRSLMAGNFGYYACYPAGTGARWSPTLAAADSRIPPAPPRALGYRLWAYGAPAYEGRDIHTAEGIPADPWLRPGPLWRPNGPDGLPDGVFLVLGERSGGTDPY